MDLCNCTLMVCDGCLKNIKRCQFIEHCDNCLSNTISCLYTAEGCKQVMPGFLMRSHTEYLCHFRPRQVENFNCCKEKNNEIFLESNVKACWDHCRFCIFVNCIDEAGCGVVECPNRCGFKMHQCKVGEHEIHTCPLALVPCLNHKFGCIESIVRSQMSKHLLTCSAYVLTCKFQWYRDVSKWKLYQACLDGSDESRVWREKMRYYLMQLSDQIVEKGIGQALVLRDQLQLYTIMANMSDGAWTNYYYGKANINNTSASSSSNESPKQRCLNDTSSSSTPIEGMSHYQQFARRSESDPLTFDAYQDKEDTFDLAARNYYANVDLSPVKFTKREIKDNLYWIDQECRSGAVDKPKRSWGKHSNGTFRFYCNQVVTRHNWEWHSRLHCDVWSEIAMSAGGAMEWRCPFSDNGCSYSVPRLIDTDGNVTAYCPLLDVFCKKPIDTVNQSLIVTESPLISKLPNEILIRIISNLDGLSLKMISFVHPRFAQIVERLKSFNKTCIITTKWYRNGLSPFNSCCRWRMVTEKSICCRQVKRSDAGLVANHNFIKSQHQHLQNCSYRYPIISHDKPFNILPNNMPNDDTIPHFLRTH